MDGDHIKLTIEYYKKYKQKIRGKFATTSVQIPQLIGVEWRLCQDIKQKNLSKINTPRFLVRLNFSNDSKMFECNYEEIQDLLNRLKIARNSVYNLIEQ
ncbi:hypothetical protein RFI_35884 [Reticulomyxa filosa]|nr:hypothetical protein RFI_35884 [Reticulomyxa filosa]|eukprot:ETO01556.1 hypothetical protein RFI_35884 [Reticulomyxa filosa]